MESSNIMNMDFTPITLKPDSDNQRTSPAELRVGRGIVKFSNVSGQTVVTRCQAGQPLRLMAPRWCGPASWIYTSSLGGGLVAGDEIVLEILAGESTVGFLTTTSSTKVYRSPDGRCSRQSLDASVADGALLVASPDPVTCFSGARYEQKQRFHLHEGGGLVLVDWLTSGRRARGERWAFASYRSRNDIWIGDKLLMVDSLHLHPGDGAFHSPVRMGHFECLALVLLAGDRLRQHSETILQSVQDEFFTGECPLISSASPLKPGVILRIAGDSTERVSQYIQKKLSFVCDFLKEDPWSRKI